MTTKSCPECGAPLNENSPFCPVCGRNLKFEKNERNIRLLLIGTPLVIFPICIIAAWEARASDPLLIGANLGTAVVLTYALAAFTQWIISKAAGRVCSAADAWLAGLYALLSVPLAVFIAIPIEYLCIGHGMAGLTLADEDWLKFGIYFCIYVILLFAGAAAIAIKSSIKPISVYLELGAGRHTEVELMVQESPIHQIHGKLKALTIIILIALATAGMEYSFLLSPSTRSLVQARLAAMTGRLSKAFAYADEAVSQDRKNAAAYYLRGQLKLIQITNGTSASDAIEDLKKAVNFAPTSMRYRITLGEALLGLGNADAAMQTASESIEINKAEPRAWMLLGDAATMLKDYDKAINAYKKAYELEPKNPVLINNLAYILLEADQDLPWALELARRSVELQPGMVYNTDTLAWALFKNGRPNDALELLLQIKEQTATFTPEIAFHNAAILHSLGLLPDPQTTFSNLLNEAETQKIPGLSENIRKILQSLPASSSATETASPTLSEQLPVTIDAVPLPENGSAGGKEGP